MARLIDADALIKKLCGDCFGNKGHCQRPCYEETLIKTMPTIEAEPPKNVFVFRSEVFYKRDDIEFLRNSIKRQVEEGIVVLPRYLTLEAVTGPCTNVEVIIKQEERT